MSMTDMPTIHPRDRVLAIARAEMGVYFARLCADQELSYGEAINVLAALLTEWSAGSIKAERQPRMRL